MRAAEFKQFRKDVIDNILYTDIREHFPLLKKFSDKIKETDNQLDRKDYSLLAAMIVHSSDFAGNTKTFEISRAWSERVNQEFTNQYSREVELGLPETPFMKNLTHLPTLAKNEAGFLGFIVQPLYESLNDYYPTNTKISKMFNTIKANKQEWDRIHQKAIESETRKSSEP